MIDTERLQGYANRTDELDCVSVEANQMARELLDARKRLASLSEENGKLVARLGLCFDSMQGMVNALDQKIEIDSTSPEEAPGPKTEWDYYADQLVQEANLLIERGTA